MSDPVNHPAHYGSADDPYEAIKVIEAWGLGFNLGNAVKYAARAGKKPGADALTDLRKGRGYFDREIARLEREAKAAKKPIEVAPAKEAHAVVASRPHVSDSGDRGWLVTCSCGRIFRGDNKDGAVCYFETHVADHTGIGRPE